MRPEVLKSAMLRLDAQISESMFGALAEEKDLLRWLLPQFKPADYAMLQHRFRDQRYDVAKYLALPFWALHKFKQLPKFGCGKGERKRRILDVGCGPCHLGLVARYCGHETIGIDRPFEEPHLYTQLCELFGIPKLDHRIEPFESLPDIGRFDRIVCTMVQFDCYPFWDVDAWQFFINDARNMLLPGGQLYITLGSDESRPAAVWDYFRANATWSSGHHAFLL